MASDLNFETHKIRPKPAPRTVWDKLFRRPVRMIPLTEAEHEANHRLELRLAVALAEREAKAKRGKTTNEVIRECTRIAKLYANWKANPVANPAYDEDDKRSKFTQIAKTATVDGKEVPAFPYQFLKLKTLAPSIVCYLNLCTRRELDEIINYSDERWRARWLDMQAAATRFLDEGEAVLEPDRRRPSGRIPHPDSAWEVPPSSTPPSTEGAGGDGEGGGQGMVSPPMKM